MNATAWCRLFVFDVGKVFVDERTVAAKGLFPDAKVRKDIIERFLGGNTFYS